MKNQSIETVSNPVKERKETPTSRISDGYHDFEESILLRFDRVKDRKHFLIPVTGLSEIFMANLPEEGKNHYNCAECKKFIDRFGGLVVIENDDSISSAIWDYQNTPPFFAASVLAMLNEIGKHTIYAEFFTEEKNLGMPKNKDGEFTWTHLHVKYPIDRVVNPAKEIYNASQKMANHAEAVKTLETYALKLYTAEHIDKAMENLLSDDFCAVKSHVAMLTEFRKLYNAVHSTKNKKLQHILIHKFVAEDTTEASHIRGTAVGDMLENIKNKLDEFDILEKYLDRIDPTKRMKSRSGASIGNMKRANEIVAKKGLERSFLRRFAEPADFDFEWTPSVKEAIVEETEPATTGGLFDSLIKEKQPKAKDNKKLEVTKSNPMTFVKFINDGLLKNAQKIELQFISHNHPILGLIDAVDKTAPGIFNYDTEEKRCTISAYSFIEQDRYNPSIQRHLPISMQKLRTSQWYNISGLILNPPYTEAGALLVLDPDSEDIIYDRVYEEHAEKYGSMIIPAALKSELHEIRKSVEMLSLSKPLENVKSSMLSAAVSDVKFNLRVTTEDTITTYVIDRFE